MLLLDGVLPSGYSPISDYHEKSAFSVTCLTWKGVDDRGET